MGFRTILGAVTVAWLGGCSPKATPMDRQSAGDAGSATAAEGGASTPDAGKAAARPLVKQAAGLVALRHVLLFDGTLTAARADQAIVLDHGKIASVMPASELTAQPGMTVLDLPGHTVTPGIVGMHDHLFYIVARPSAPGEPGMRLLPELFYSAPRLYLAGGVTTLRTTGSVEPYADLNLRRLIDDGAMPGPEMDVTAPYMEGREGLSPQPVVTFLTPQMASVNSAAEARRFVDFWADAGATSFKAYAHISREALRAAIDETHRRGMKVTGHLCSVTYAEAVAMGIDDLEHGFFSATDGAPGKRPDECPAEPGRSALLGMAPDSEPVQTLLKTLVAHHVALTSTLPAFERVLPGRGQAPRAVALLDPILQARYFDARKKVDADSDEASAARWRNDLALERAFVGAGGLLLAGPDTGFNGAVLPGFGDQREIELLVEAGFSAVEAIHIATYNGAQYLGRLNRIGTIAPGKQADLVVVRGDPGAHIQDMENVEIVFKKGVGYDPDALLESARGTVGLY